MPSVSSRDASVGPARGRAVMQHVSTVGRGFLRIPAQKITAVLFSGVRRTGGVVVTMSDPQGIVCGVRFLLLLLLLSGCAASATPETSGLLQAARGGDGDSWKDTAGVEYRLGLINTPELSECFGSTARLERQRLVAKGFRAQAYSKDRFGRAVAVVTLADGRNLNVYLARQGFADDRYLADFRAENPALARDLDVAFAAAKRERVGLWGACRR